VAGTKPDVAKPRKRLAKMKENVEETKAVEGSILGEIRFYEQSRPEA
jgi:hypothetical protein